LWSVLAETMLDIEEVSQGRQSGSILLRASSYEVDPIQLGHDSRDDHLVNMLHLKLAAQTAFNKIKQSEFPVEIVNVLQQIRKKMKKIYPELALSVMANFVFLRFICPAITSPSKYGLYRKPPVGKNLRFLVLLSKVLQNLAFGIEFEKEKYMTDLNDFISNNKDSMNNWIDEISSLDDNTRSRNYPVVDVSEVVKQNSLKWLYAAMYSNRQVLKRELAKKLTENDWQETLELLNKIGIVINRTGSSGMSGSGSTDSKSVNIGGDDSKSRPPISPSEDDTTQDDNEEED